MLAGELCDPLDPELVAARERARDSCRALNAAGESAQTERRRILHDLFGAGGDSVWLQPPFYCDYVLTPLHPFDAAARRQREFGKPLEIGADVWVGGGALIYGRRA